MPTADPAKRRQNDRKTKGCLHGEWRHGGRLADAWTARQPDWRGGPGVSLQEGDKIASDGKVARLDCAVPFKKPAMERVWDEEYVSLCRNHGASGAVVEEPGQIDLAMEVDAICRRPFAREFEPGGTGVISTPLSIFTCPHLPCYYCHRLYIYWKVATVLSRKSLLHGAGLTVALIFWSLADLLVFLSHLVNINFQFTFSSLNSFEELLLVVDASLSEIELSWRIRPFRKSQSTGE
jgi:hypothetical protein